MISGNEILNRRYVEIDLSQQSVEWRRITEKDLSSLFLGSGFAAKLMSLFPLSSQDLFDPNMPLMVFNGLLTGSFAPTACRTTWCSISPLTRIWNEANMGGTFGAQMNRSGVDGIVVIGKSDSPTYVLIQQGRVNFYDARDLWGKDHFQADKILAQRHGSDSQSASIGIAGERQVLLSSILHGGVEHTRAAGRGGMGALMGSKNLKAIVVKGDRQPGYPNVQKMRHVVQPMNRLLREKTVIMAQLGTAGGVVASENAGDFPIKNWILGSWKDGAAKISGQSIYPKYLDKHNHCFACPIGCSKNVHVDSKRFGVIQGHGPEYETLGGFGGNCLCDDLEAILYMNELCNRYGLDTISTSASIAFAMEAYEKRVIPADVLGDLKPVWGDANAMIQMIHSIAHQQGLGIILGLGVRNASKAFPGSEEFAVHVKGLEVAYHDPRAFIDMAVNYSTANRGGCHLEGCSYWMGYGSRWPDWYNPSDLDPHDSLGKAKISKDFQDYFSVYNPLGLCKFLIKSGISPNQTTDLVNAAMSWAISTEELLEIGERIFNQKRMINYRLGIRKTDDILPPRLSKESRPSGGAKGVLPKMTQLLDEYYQHRGWDSDGKPSEETARRLRLINL